MASVFDTKIEYLKGVGPQRAELLNKELKVYTYGDLIQYLPFRYEDRSQIHPISSLQSDQVAVQLKGKIRGFQLDGEGRKKRLKATFYDSTGSVELIWFKGVDFIRKAIKPETDYYLYGKPNAFQNRYSFAHPELDLAIGTAKSNPGILPVYPLTEKLKRKYIDSKAIAKMQARLFEVIFDKIPETLPRSIFEEYKFMGKANAMRQVHFPENQRMLDQAKARLKFEELFYIQLKVLREKGLHDKKFKGHVFSKIPLVTQFYNDHLPFDLTDAQKRVIREIRNDFGSGIQMNRLLQGDVGSGKTIVAFICMLMAIDNEAQACLMAPTEILAQQHFTGLKEFADMLDLKIELLTGSTKKAKRREILEQLENGELHILIGTHALLEDWVQFKNLGLCVIDEQHRFGVAQRARLWAKNTKVYPHVLVMTATPIPRTLAMTVYGDLNVSVIDELPAGRKPIQTVHRYDESRLRVFGFMREQIAEGRQVYVVYPLIEESSKSDLKDLMDGFESISRAFPEQHLSIVHGKMKPADKDYEMQRFVKGETQIMVATTVIEVGVNVPNATVMVIENAERFGLAQLHQLRGRVGRGGSQSYCILMTSYKLSKEGRTRIETMVRTNNGFEIADVDLKLRGPGDLAGTQQSGVLDLLFADLSKDSKVLEEARSWATHILTEDPELHRTENQMIIRHINSLKKDTINWGRIS